MTDDLTARLTGALHGLEAREAAAPPPAELAAIHRDVRRRRTLRTAQYASVAAVTVLAVGTAGWFGLHRTPVEPVEAPSPTPTRTATPTPTAAPTPTLTPTLTPTSTPVAVAGMPPLLSLPDGALDAAGPGWFLLAYQPLVFSDDQRTVLALSAPTGELYLVAESADGLEVLRWTGGATARVRLLPAASSADGEPVVGDYDLRTGAFTPDERVDGDDSLVATLPGGVEVWQRSLVQGAESTHRLRVVPVDGAPTELAAPGLWHAALSPDGDRLVSRGGFGVDVSVVDLRSGATTALAVPPGQTCAVSSWLDDDSLLATCRDEAPISSEFQYLEDLGGQVVRLDAAGGPPVVVRTLGAGDVAPGPGAWLRDGVAIVSHLPLTRAFEDCFDVCYGGAYLWEEGEVTVVPGTADLPDDVCAGTEPAGDRLLVRTGFLFCYEEPGASSRLWSVDLAGGAARLVGPTLDEPGALGVAGRHEATSDPR